MSTMNIQLLYLLYLYNKYENVCLSVQLFLDHFETDLDALWHKVAFSSCEGFNSIIFLIGGFNN